MKRAVLIVLTVAAFLLSLQYGFTVYQRHVPPFKEGACLELDYSKVFKTEISEPTPVLVSIERNYPSDGVSETIVVYYELSMGVYLASKEVLTFYDLRSSGAKEVSCEVSDE